MRQNIERVSIDFSQPKSLSQKKRVSYPPVMAIQAISSRASATDVPAQNVKSTFVSGRSAETMVVSALTRLGESPPLTGMAMSMRRMM